MTTTVTPLPRVLAQTKIRALPRPPAWTRLSLGVLAKIAPDLVVEQLYRAYFTPMRHHAGVEERSVLADATQTSLSVAGHDVVRYVWDRPELPWDPPLLRSVLLMHGWAGSAAQMTPFVAPLLRAGFRVVAIDAPGHGRAPGHRATLVDFAQLVNALTDEHTAIVAHSLGATAVLLALQGELRAPKLALLATGANVDAYPARFADAAGTPRLGNALLGRLLSEFGEQVLRPAEHPVLRVVATPTLLVHDLDDAEAPYAGSALLASRITSSRLVTTAGLGHRRLLRDVPVVDEVVRFLSG